MLILIIISQPIVTRARKRCLDLLCLLPSSLSRPSSVLPLLSARNRTALAPALLVKMTKIKPAKLHKCFPSSTRSIGLTLGTSLKNGLRLEWAVAKWTIDSDDCCSTLSQNWPAINTSIIFFMEGCNNGLVWCKLNIQLSNISIFTIHKIAKYPLSSYAEIFTHIHPTAWSLQRRSFTIGSSS